ncbi:hypothetical protein ACIRN4_23865 [Pimelobacter simplex]|uniref:hypothetical protein n=1 Tax=Nocardioides simplex TaxID=2045 RepID=UPI00382BFF39
MSQKVTIGVDIGNRNDRFALVSMWRTARGVTVFDARAKKGVSSDEVVDSCLATIIGLHNQIPRGINIQIAPDRTGLGWGPTETLAKQIRHLRAPGMALAGRTVQIAGVAITAGDGVTRDEDESWKWNVGRDRLVGQTLMALRTEALSIRGAGGDAAPLLAEELRDLVENSTKSGKTRIDHKPGKHDDVFMALCLGYWFSSSTGLGGYAPIGSRSPLLGTLASAEGARVPEARPTATRPASAPEKGAAVASPDLLAAKRRRSFVEGLSRTVDRRHVR